MKPRLVLAIVPVNLYGMPFSYTEFEQAMMLKADSSSVRLTKDGRRLRYMFREGR